MSTPPERTITVDLWLYIGNDGRPIKNQIRKGSGDAQVDHLAVDAASVARFSPALLDGQPVAAWLNLPLVMNWQARRMPLNRSLMPPL